jgi:hypothetical protein
MTINNHAVLETTNTLAAAQGVGAEAAEDETKVCEDGHFVPLNGGLLHFH